MVMSKPRQVTALKGILKGKKIATDTVDLDSLIDSSLSYSENKRIILEKLMLEKPEFKEDHFDYLEAREKLKEEDKFEKQKKRDLNQSKRTLVDTTKFYGNLPDLTEMINLGFTNSLWVIGGAGVGKTTQIEYLTKGKMIKIQGHITPYKLVNILYEHRDNYILFFDDTEDLLRDKGCITILKQGLETSKKRYISWDSRNSKIPKTFPITSKIVFCVNSIPNDLGMKAILSRSHKIELILDYFTILKIMYTIAQKEKKIKNEIISSETRKSIVDFIEKNSSPATKEFSLRSQFKIEQYYAYSKEKWQKLARDLLEVDKNLSLILELNKNLSYPTVDSKQRQWSKETGMSRKTFYNYKKKVGK